MGNIVEVSENGIPVSSYEYDSLGRLVRENNKKFGKTYFFAYDRNGNILAKYEYAYTKIDTDELNTLEPQLYIPYYYDDDSDRLLSYGNETFEYDDIGNPTNYRGKTANWANGRQLTSLIHNNTTTTFEYDARGRRISKEKAGETKITFTYDYNGNLIKQSNGLDFLYDHTGVFAFTYGGSTYFYRKNAQGDIIAILDNDGEIVVKYVYDAWGNCKVYDITGTEITDETHIGILNPFRYRSYYYDVETKLYFLKTRYYDPEIGRFMTIDDLSYLDPDSINGLNLYAYCLNNPVMGYDPTGTFALTTFLICLAVGAIIGGAVGGYTAYSNGQDILTGVLTGGLLGVSVGVVIGIGGAVLSGALSSLASKAMTDLLGVVFYGGNFGTWEDYAIAFAFGGLSSSLSSIISNGGRIVSTIAQGGKFVSDTLLRPAANQAVKIGTRGASFNQQKLFYDAVTRAATYFGTPQIVKGNVLGYDIKIDIGKSFNRATTRYIYTYFMG